VNDTTLVYTWIDEADIIDIPAGSTAMDGSVGAFPGYASSTLNWEYDAEDFPLIINLFLKYLGISLPDNILFEGGTLLETKQDE
jgi:hypothetical protein